MKNIMLIVIATLTIATANATNWTQIQSWRPLQIVNNTNVTLVLITEPDGGLLTIPAGATVSGSSVNETSALLAWQYGSEHSTFVDNVYLDLDEYQYGNMGSEVAVYTDHLMQGQYWLLYNIGTDDTLTITGTSIGNGIELTLTRTRGVKVVRTTGDNGDDVASVFCLTTGVFFNLQNGDWGRCPTGNTGVVMAKAKDLVWNNQTFDDWDAGGLIAQVFYNYSFGSNINSMNPNFSISGMSTYDFDSLPYYDNNAYLGLALHGDGHCGTGSTGPHSCN